MSSLTDEQRSRIEINRQKALERRRLAQLSEQKRVPTPFTQHQSLPSSRPLSAISASTRVPPSFAVSWSTGSKVGRTGGPTQSSAAKFYGSRVTVHLSLLDEHRFVAECEYCAPVLERFRCIASRRYDNDTKRWSFALADHDTLVSLLRNLPSAQITLHPLPPFLLRAMREPAPPPAHTIDLSRVEAPLRDALMPFQREGVQLAVARGGRLLLADDMGLGKTLQALAVMSYYGDWPLLVLCPASVRYHWQQTVHRYLPSLPADSVQVLLTARDAGEVVAAGTCCVLIVGYDLLAHAQCARQLAPSSGGCDVKFPSVIADESHCLKNFRSARSRCSQPLLVAARRCLLLSGTPALSRPAELFTQISAVCGRRQPRLFSGFSQFAERYCAGDSGSGGGSNFVSSGGASNLVELQILLARRVMVRRMKRDIITQLPDKQRTMVLIGCATSSDLTPAISHLRQQLSASAAAPPSSSAAAAGGRGWRAGGGSSRPLPERRQRDGVLLQYFRESAAIKMAAVCRYMDQLLDSAPADTQILCFAHHRQMMDALCALLDRRCVGFVRIDGATSSAQRQERCDSFQRGGVEVRVAVLSVTAAGVGITMTAASLLVFAELFWNPGVLSQAEDRAHRIGQLRTVQVQYLVMQNTADDHIWPLVQRKLNILNQVGLGGDNFDAVQKTTHQSPTKATQPPITDWFEQLEEFDDETLQQLDDSECDVGASKESGIVRRKRPRSGSSESVSSDAEDISLGKD